MPPPGLSWKKNDIVLRDRGYLTTSEVARHTDAGADSMYRHKTGATWLDAETREPIDLLAALRRKGYLDRLVLVLLGKEEKRPPAPSAPLSAKRPPATAG